MSGPLTGLQGFSRTDAFATAEQRQGNAADPRHNVLGETTTPYPWEQFPGESHGPYGMENGLLGVDVFSAYTSPAGEAGQDPTMDLTPVHTQAAPWPKGLPSGTDPDTVAAWRAQQDAIHAVNMGGSRDQNFIPTGDPVQDEWVEVWETDPGMLFPNQEQIPNQSRGSGVMGWGSRDRTQSNATQNGYGFDAAHMHRRYAVGSIPGNYLWMQPGSRPLIKTHTGTANVPVGPDSPFAGQLPVGQFDPQGAALLNLPNSHTPPFSPALADTVAPAVSDSPEVSLW